MDNIYIKRNWLISKSTKLHTFIERLKMSFIDIILHWPAFINGKILISWYIIQKSTSFKMIYKYLDFYLELVKLWVLKVGKILILIWEFHQWVNTFLEGLANISIYWFILYKSCNQWLTAQGTQVIECLESLKLKL